MNKMWQISLFVWIICISTVSTRRYRPGRGTELNTMNLVINAYQSLGNVHIDGLSTHVLTNAKNWSLTDHIAVSSMSRLIALEGIVSSGDPLCAGVLASVNDTYLLTNSSWRCVTYSPLNWTGLGFDDSSWPSAAEYGTNGNHATCSQQRHFDDINSNAKWIWSSDTKALVVYCRGYLPLCLTSSPCLNGGTCLPNHKKMCDCTPEYTGTYCESLLMDGSLVVTAYKTLVNMYIDGIEQPLINGSRWDYTDRAGLTETNRLVAVKAKSDGTCGGILASFGDAYVLTNNQWKCSPYNFGNWYGLGFNDSQQDWYNAAEFGSNADGHTQCSGLHTIPDISLNAMWIWIPDQTDGGNVFCRGYMPVCDSSPCLNNGTCLKNNVRMCDCQPLFTGTYCETEIITTTRPTKPTTEMTTQSQTTEGITTSSLQTTEVTTIPQTTTLQTTESATTIAATTIAATTIASTTIAATTIAATTIAATTIAATTIAATTPTITTPTTTTPTTTTPTTITPTTTTPTTTTPTTTPTTTTPTTPSTIYTGLVSTTSDPPPAPTCTEDLYCNGPLEKPGASIEHCACPADYLNVNNNCCMSQNWIIGLACLSAGILIIIFLIIIACLCCKDHSDHSSMGDSVDLVDRDHLGADAHSMDHMTYVSETQMGNHKKPEGGIVDAHGVIAAHGVKEDALHAKADAHLASEKGHHVPATRRHSLVSGATGVNTLRGLNPSGEHTLSQYPIYTLGRRRGQPAYRSMIERGRREDFFYNPLMVELLSNDIYRHFRPSLGGIPTNVDYSIQRPEIELEFLYNELYGSDLHRGGIYDYRSPWNMDMNMRL